MNMAAECTISKCSAGKRVGGLGTKEGEGDEVREAADRGVLGWVERKICGIESNVEEDD